MNPEESVPKSTDEQSQKLSQSEAVRRALEAGIDDPRAGTAYILKEYGIEVTLSYFSAILATERKKGWEKRGKPGRKSKESRTDPEIGIKLEGLFGAGGEDAEE